MALASERAAWSHVEGVTPMKSSAAADAAAAGLAVASLAPSGV